MKINVVYKVNESKNFKVLGVFEGQDKESDYLSCIVHILNNEFRTKYHFLEGSITDNPFRATVECQEYLHNITVEVFEITNP